MRNTRSLIALDECARQNYFSTWLFLLFVLKFIAWCSSQNGMRCDVFTICFYICAFFFFFFFGPSHSTSSSKFCHTHYCLRWPMLYNNLLACPHSKSNPELYQYVHFDTTRCYRLSHRHQPAWLNVLFTWLTTEYFTSDWRLRSSSDVMVIPILDTVRNAARFAVKVDIMMTAKNQKPAISSLPDKLLGGSPPPAR